MNTSQQRARADVVVIVPLDEEFVALKNVITFRRVPVELCPPVLPTLYEAVVGAFSVIACVLHEMANEHSSMITDRCISHLDPSLVVGLGIAGALHKDALLGDVVLSRTVRNVTFESKVVSRRGGGIRTEPSANGPIPIDNGLYDYATNFRESRADAFRLWREAGRE